jgi:hypothetical protein
MSRGASLQSCSGCLPAGRSHRGYWYWMGRLLLRFGWPQAAASNGNGWLTGGPAGVGYTARCTQKRLPGSRAERARAPQLLRGECAAQPTENAGSQWVGYAVFRLDGLNAMVGFAHRFRPTYAGANVGHPFSSVREASPLSCDAHRSIDNRKVEFFPADLAQEALSRPSLPLGTTTFAPPTVRSTATG